MSLREGALLHAAAAEKGRAAVVFVVAVAAEMLERRGTMRRDILNAGVVVGRVGGEVWYRGRSMAVSPDDVMERCSNRRGGGSVYRMSIVQMVKCSSLSRSADAHSLCLMPAL